MTTNNFCPECGKPLPSDSPQGLCPQCLMKRGMESSIEDSGTETGHMSAIVSPSQSPDIELSPGTKLGNYLIERELGRGGMGIVYKAHEESLQRVVALKILAPALVRDPAYAQRFLREARAGARLHHPNIVPVYAVGKIEGHHYISMAYVKGAPLSTLVQQKGQLPVNKAIDIARQIADALTAAHAQGIVHRDIKPDNIMIDQAGRVQVMDFGLARVISAHTQLTGDHSILGTPSYMSPEQCSGSKVDGRSDLYSLGIVLFEMLAGKTPFRGDSPVAIMYQIQKDPPPPLQEINSSVPPEVVKVVEKLIAKKPDERFLEAKQVCSVLTRLQGWRRDALPTAKLKKQPRSKSSERTGKRFSTKYLGIGAGALAVFAIAGLLITPFMSPSPQPQPDVGLPAVPTESADSQDLPPLPSPTEVAVSDVTDAETTDPLSTEAPSARIIQFPTDRAVGMIGIGEWGTKDFHAIFRNQVLTAQGTVSIPAGQEAILFLTGDNQDFSFLADLKPDDLQGLNFRQNQINDAQLQYIDHFTGLRSLAVYGAGITNRGLSQILQYDGLTMLDISATRITPTALWDLASCKTLEQITLGNLRLTDPDLAFLDHMPQLTAFNSWGNPGITNRSLPYFERLANLELLQLYSSTITGELERIAHLEHLNGISFGDAPVAAEEFKKLKTLPALEYMYLEFTEDFDIIVDALSEYPALESLNFGRTMRTRPDHIEQLQRIPGLRTLGLANPGSDDSLIPSLSKLTGLEELNLGGKTGITGEGMLRLREALPNCEINR